MYKKIVTCEVGRKGIIMKGSGKCFAKFSNQAKKMIDKKFGLIMVLPAFFILILIIVGPVLYTLFLSFHDWFASSVSAPKWIGLNNFVRVFTEIRFYQSLKKTLIFTFIGISLQIILGICLAQFLNRPFKGKGLVRTLLILPIASTPVAISLVWKLMLEPTLGIINYFLTFLGWTPPTWLSDPVWALPTLIVIDVWQWTPLVMLIVMAGMSTIPDTLYEAAKIDGASSKRIFTNITLPLIKPSIVVAAMLRVMDSLKQFDMVYVTTQGGPGTATQILNLYVFDNAFRYFRMGYASSLIIVMFMIILTVNVFLSRVRRSHDG